MLFLGIFELKYFNRLPIEPLRSNAVGIN